MRIDTFRDGSNASVEERIVVLTMMADDGRVWHRLEFIAPSGARASIDLSAAEARDLYLKLKVLVDKEPGDG